ncbi:hypothetical protein [Pseudoalteromonas luteoviolacea]|uniref:hypothetical protein n=1 Tax=Pseudoalteromonas luteoviolacea TaxID=43657 RepID=UPI001B371B43|nr:hypothetical protein [Pseudoalteromonas luteoviolacea]MBQ4834795.1 hypothetical protein [Pseudoalteromonas luteoviolacea]
MIRAIAILIFSIMLSSCAVKPAKVLPVDYKYDDNVKIGFVSLISEKPTHSHIGITVFNNFTKDLDVKWELNQHIFDALSKEFNKQKSYELVNLSQDPSSKQFFHNQNLFTKKGDFTDVNGPELNSIVNSLSVKDLDAIIVVRSLKVFYNQNFESIRESMGKQGDHGFKSRTGEGMTFNSAIGINMYSIEPKTHYVGWQYLGLIGQKVIPQPSDYENLTISELSSYEKQLKDNINNKVKEFVSKAP